MDIITADGWKRLQPKTVIAAAVSDDRYRGALPSPQILGYLRRLETEIIKQRSARLQTHAQAA